MGWQSQCSSRDKSLPLQRPSTCQMDETLWNCYPGRQVGVDPGKKNLVTMIDKDGVVLRYTCRQWMFECQLTRHHRVLEVEKLKVPGLLAEERALSLHSRKSNDIAEFKAYMKTKKTHNKVTTSFYLQEKWRHWKFRIFCNCKDSLARIASCTTGIGPGRPKCLAAPHHQ